MSCNVIRKMSNIEINQFFDYITSFDEYKSIVELIQNSFTNAYIVLKSEYNKDQIENFQYSTEFPVVHGGARLTQSIILYSAIFLNDTDLVIVSSLERRPHDAPLRIPGLFQLHVPPYGVLDIINPEIIPPQKIIGIGSNSPTIFMLFKSDNAINIANFDNFFEKNCLYCMVNVFDDDTFIILQISDSVKPLQNGVFMESY